MSPFSPFLPTKRWKVRTTAHASRLLRAAGFRDLHANAGHAGFDLLLDQAPQWHRLADPNFDFRLAFFAYDLTAPLAGDPAAIVGLVADLYLFFALAGLFPLLFLEHGCEVGRQVVGLGQIDLDVLIVDGFAASSDGVLHRQLLIVFRGDRLLLALFDGLAVGRG